MDFYVRVRKTFDGEKYVCARDVRTFVCVCLYAYEIVCVYACVCVCVYSFSMSEGVRMLLSYIVVFELAGGGGIKVSGRDCHCKTAENKVRFDSPDPQKYGERARMSENTLK